MNAMQTDTVGAAKNYHDGKAPDDSDAFVPFDVKWPRESHSPVDVRFLLDAPAGNRGWITVKDGHLAYADGQRFRVYGVNLTNKGAVPEHDSAVRIAENLARCGVNCVRLGPAEALQIPDNDRRTLCPEALDRFDFLVAELNKRGIYSYLRLDYGIRGYGPKDGVPDHSYPALYFNPQFQKLHRNYARQLLTHENPYTGRRYADDPAVLFLELTNEMSILGYWLTGKIHQELEAQKNRRKDSGTVPTLWHAKQWSMVLEYVEELLRLYNNWLAENVPSETMASWRRTMDLGAGAPIPLLDVNARADAPKERFQAEVNFFMHLERGFFLSTKEFLRNDLGLQSLIIGNSNHSHGTHSLALVSSTALLDVVDTHYYWQHPGAAKPDSTMNAFYDYAEQRTRDNTPLVDVGGSSPIGTIARSALQGKPLLMSEYNSSFPQEFAAEAIPLFASYAAFQDWDGIILHTLCNRDIVTRSEQVGRPFDIAKDPQKMSQLAVGALLFLRPDVHPAQETILCSYSADQVREAVRTPNWFPLSQRVALTHGIRTSSLAGEPSSRQDNTPVPNPAVSDTGELTLYAGSPVLGTEKTTGYFTVDTDRSQALVGFFNKHSLQLKNLAAETDCPFCAITVSSLDGKPIAETETLYVTANARVANTGMRWSEDRKMTEVWGVGPVRIEPVAATLRLRGLKNARRVLVTPLDSAGGPIGAGMAAPVEGGKCSLLLNAMTNAYIIRIER